MLNNEYTQSIISLMHVCNTDKYLQHEPENKNKNINLECLCLQSENWKTMS